MLNGVLVTFLVDNGVFDWDTAQMGTLIGIPVLTGSIMRLPLGVLTDKFGGKPVYSRADFAGTGEGYEIHVGTFHKMITDGLSGTGQVIDNAERYSGLFIYAHQLGGYHRR